MKSVYVLALLMAFSSASFAAESTPPPAEAQSKVRYRKAKDVDFEALLLQGQIQRPDISVVTGDANGGTDGLLRLRENFLDRVAIDAGEEIP